MTGRPVVPSSILFIERGGEVGGAERVLLDIVSGVDRSRYRPVAACLADGALPAQLRSLGVPTGVFPVGRLRELHHVVRALIGLVRLVRSERVDLVHVNGTMMLLYGGPVAWVSRRPLVWQAYDPQSRGGMARRVFVAVVSRFRPDWTIFSTVPVERNHLDLFPRIGRHSTILPGVDVGDFGTTQHDRGVLPPGVPGDAVVMLALARHVPGKGLEDLISAMAQLHGQRPELHLVLCGGLPAPGYTERLQELVARLAVGARVSLVGHVPEATKRGLLAACDLVVHPAPSEPFGLAVLEAMAAAKPVVAADAPGPSHLIVNGITGLVYPRGEVGALVAALSRLAGDPVLRRTMGAAARARAEEFSLGRMVGAVEQVWGDVLAATRDVPAGEGYPRANPAPAPGRRRRGSRPPLRRW